MDLVRSEETGTGPGERLAKSISQEAVDERVDAGVGVGKSMREDLVDVRQFSPREGLVELKPDLKGMDWKPEGGKQHDYDGHHLGCLPSPGNRMQLLKRWNGSDDAG